MEGLGGLTMKVLVTGYNGYVGTVMTPMLLAAGHEVVGMDTNLYQGSTFGEESIIENVPSIDKEFGMSISQIYKDLRGLSTWRGFQTIH